MFCRKCGEQNADSSLTCSRCGEPLTRPAPAAAPAQTVPSHLAPAILVTLFCCLPFGVVAIVYAAQAMSKSGVGDYAGATVAARSAKLWCWLSFGAGIVVIIGWFVIAIIPAIFAQAR